MHIFPTKFTQRRDTLFENKVLTLFEPKKEEVTGGWRKIREEELQTCTLHLMCLEGFSYGGR
jgi:hypothetical protein